MNANISRLNSIKNDISTNKIAIDGFNQAFSDLGITLSGSDQDLLDKYYELQNDLARAKTKYINEKGRKIFHPKRINWSYL